MTKVKEASTWNANKSISESHCPITYVMNKVGGHWKPIILYHLKEGPKRYSDLKRAIPAITEKMLVQHLKQLCEHMLISKEVVQLMPPITTYTLTDSGIRLVPVLLLLADWAMQDSDKFKELMQAMPGTSQTI